MKDANDGWAFTCREAAAEAQTEKPFDVRAALDGLLEVAQRAATSLADFLGHVPIGERRDLGDVHAELVMRCESIRAVMGPREHRLKADPGPFQLVKARLKAFEVRRFDRDFRVGDRLTLVEFDRETRNYSGAWVSARITSIVRPKEYGLPEDVGVLGIEVMAEGG